MSESTDEPGAGEQQPAPAPYDPYRAPEPAATPEPEPVVPTPTATEYRPEPPTATEPVVDLTDDDAAEDEDEGDLLLAPAAAGTQTPRWVNLVNSVGVALCVVVALELVAIVAQSLTVTGGDARIGSAHKLGYFFFRDLDAAPIGLLLVVAAVLTLLPTVARTPTTERQDRTAAIVLGLTGALALLIAAGALLGVLADSRIAQIRNEDLNSVRRWSQASFLIRNMGTALVAFGLSMAAVRLRFNAPVVVVDEPEVD